MAISVFRYTLRQNLSDPPPRRQGIINAGRNPKWSSIAGIIYSPIIQPTLQLLTPEVARFEIMGLLISRNFMLVWIKVLHDLGKTLGWKMTIIEYHGKVVNT